MVIPVTLTCTWLAVAEEETARRQEGQLVSWGDQREIKEKKLVYPGESNPGPFATRAEGLSSTTTTGLTEDSLLVQW